MQMAANETVAWFIHRNWLFHIIITLSTLACTLERFNFVSPFLPWGINCGVEQFFLKRRSTQRSWTYGNRLADQIHTHTHTRHLKAPKLMYRAQCFKHYCIAFSLQFVLCYLFYSRLYSNTTHTHTNTTHNTSLQTVNSANSTNRIRAKAKCQQMPTVGRREYAVNCEHYAEPL